MISRNTPVYAQNWTGVRSLNFCVVPELVTAAVSSFGLDLKLGTRLPDPEVENSLTVW